MSHNYAAVNDILQAHGASEDKLTVRVLTYEEDDLGCDRSPETFVLLEGTREALKFLAETILAHIETTVCDLTMHPLHAGSAHFSSTSTAGIILHTVPCANGPYGWSRDTHAGSRGTPETAKLWTMSFLGVRNGTIVPTVETCSIDESFLNLGEFNGREVEPLARELRDCDHRWAGTPIFVGIAPTKTLAKVANFIAMKHPQHRAICDLRSAVCGLRSSRVREELLPAVPVEEIWGIGRASAASSESRRRRT
ncbi:hypothetical protein [Acidipila sp. EB88]|uniref:Y-family DNA polymerase n=1 Tax=Acidipila sp. EB88 TaxID=2305226 RepID=UPI000F5E07D7|nr:hypothetical protein [Acidipila sp. EB88]RRA49357.1 hypothetical protein D1Y84_14785 [Acidipila sp. EB88]